MEGNKASDGEKAQDESADDMYDSDESGSRESPASSPPQQTKLVSEPSFYSRSEQRQLARQSDMCDQYNVIAVENALAVSPTTNTLAENITNKWLQFTQTNDPNKLVNVFWPRALRIYSAGPRLDAVECCRIDKRMDYLPHSCEVVLRQKWAICKMTG